MARTRGDSMYGAKDETISWLFNHSQELFFVVDTAWNLQFANPAWGPTTGWTEDELVGRRFLDIIHPDDHELISRAGEELGREGIVQTISRVALKDGGWRWIEWRAQLTDDGRIIGLAHDATRIQARERELVDARKTRSLLSEAAGVGTWSYDPVSEVLEWSAEILKVVGYTAQEIGSLANFLELLDPQEADDVIAAFGRGVAEGAPGTVEHRIRAADGRWLTFRATFRTEPASDSQFQLKGISQDVTELAAARDIARQGERDTRQLIEGSPFAVAMFDNELRYRMVSPRWVQAFGLQSRPHIGVPLQDLFTTMPAHILQACQRALAGEVLNRDEDRFTDNRGLAHWVRWEMRPWRQADGTIGGLLIYLDDISSAVKSKLEAQTNSRRLKMALAAADAGVYEVDHVNRTFWASPELQRMIGESNDFDAVRTLRFPRFHPDDLDQVRAGFLAVHHGPAPSEGFEARILSAQGGERWVRIYHHLAKDEQGRWQKAVGLVQDIDARKRQELALIEAERAALAGADAKAAFLANMSHEIRTPMNGVLGVLHLLKSEQLTEDARKLLDEALSCGQMLSELLNDVIDFSKIEAGHLELAFEAIDPRALIDGVVSLLRPQAEAKGLAIRVEMDPNVGWIWSDPVRLRQALFNLIGNAVKFTLDGHITVACRSIASDAGPHLRFEISDTGIGVPAAAKSRLFQRFDQGDASTTRKFGGSGLGLAITKRLAEIMGGDVGFTSDEGVGSTFWIDVAAEPAEAVAPKTAGPEAVLDGLHILVVEDNSTNRLIATKLLEGLGARVETAEDGLIGVEAAEWGMFDLILMDVQMPGIDGLEATRRIRALPDAASRTPIIALTANVLAHQQLEYRAAGMDGVVAKPISPEALVREIARLSREVDDTPVVADASDAA